MSNAVIEELRRARERLLDMSARNRLLNFRPAKRTSIRIVDELPAEVWRLLVTEGKELSFLAREEHESLKGQQTPPGPPAAAPDAQQDEPEQAVLFNLPDVSTVLADGKMPGRYQDLFLQTTLDADNLQTNLLRIDQAARSALEERGVNFLFIALGFVVWRPADGSQQEFRGPVVLVPVCLERAGARKRFRLSALDQDPVLNPCLRAKLARDAGVALPDEPEDWDAFDVEAYLLAVEKAISGLAGWRVTRDIYLGLFSFTKYLMYLDLDIERWPQDRRPCDSPLVRVLCGDATVQGLTGLPEAQGGPDDLDPQQVFEVQDADSSQMKAILAAKAGASLVIEGPPGTGKSQTITNIIAECLAAGRSVLFVSEKMAALEVVKNRLEKVGLGRSCLELHSTKSNRRSVLQALSAAWHGEQAQAAGDNADRLIALRRRLNAYAQALHEPILPSGLSPFDAMGRAILLKDVPDVVCDLPGFDRWDRSAFSAQKELVEGLARHLDAVHPTAEHPWRGARVRSVTSQLQRTVSDLLGRLSQEIGAAQRLAGPVAAQLGVATPTTPDALRLLLRTARLVCDSPAPCPRLVREGLWDEQPPDMQALLGRVKMFVQDTQWVAARYRLDAVRATEWRPIHERSLLYWSSVFRFLRPQFYRDRRAIESAFAAEYRPSHEEQMSDLGRLARFEATRGELDNSADVGTRYFDAAWKGASSDWPRLLSLGEWLRQFRAAVRQGAVGEAGIALAAAGADRSEFQRLAAEFEQRLNAWAEAWTALTDAVRLQPDRLFSRPPTQAPMDEWQRVVSDMAQGQERLLDWAQYQDALQTCESGPLAAFIGQASAQAVEPQALVLALEKQYARLLAEKALAEREALRRFSGLNHEADRTAYAELDRAWVRQTGCRLRAKLAAERPAANLQAAKSSQVGILLGEISRKRGGRSIRKLLRDAGEAVQRLTPCFMMSPLSVSQFIDPAGIRFDVVVFDEASQVEPADAIGAVARGQQVILVGDPKQLPPTDFFNVMAESDAAGDEGMAGIVDMESILQRGLDALPQVRLRWHYRSRHESLIAFSNREFYDNDLVVFPSCHTGRDELGLRMCYEPSDAYDRGRGQRNRPQAARIAQWIGEFARSHPAKSLGVGAFSVAQQQAILDEVEKLRLQDAALDEFFSRDRPEPFFVKNLETIQGDERDVIVLSVGYGKSQEHERLSMNFGPLNQDAGWRRLNVLVTRARERCVVFSSIRAEDFDLTATQARGVQALRDYLEYALTGRLTDVGAGDDESGSDFERAVYNALSDRGLTLRRQVGCAGYAIDLAVIDPKTPGRYLLGIECDGATYRGLASARDRDRLRQQVLEGLGWRMHRIWATDWFRQPQREIDRALDAVRRAASGNWQPMLRDEAPSPASPETPGGGPAKAAPLAQPYRSYHSAGVRTAEDFYAGSLAHIAQVLAKVVECEGPIRLDLALRRAAAVWGLTRMGPKIQDRATQALDVCQQKGTVLLRDGFLWPAGMTIAPVRCRDADELRDIDLVCLDEIGQAACAVLRSQMGMSRQDLVLQTARLLGFASAGSRVAARIEDAIQDKLGSGEIQTDPSGSLRAP